MIRTVRANRASFREVEFTPGLNVVMADRTKDSTKKDSRNGLGKSTLVEIIHFALGGKGTALKPLAGWAFTVGLRLGGRELAVTRTVDDPRKVVVTGDVHGLEVGRRQGDGLVASVADWTELLGLLMFDLTPRARLGEWSPTFRSLISYFVRQGKDAYSSPFRHFPKQQEWDVQVANAFLLGLSWEDAQAWQVIREKAKALDALRAAAKSGVLAGLTGSMGELEAEKVRLQEQASREATALRTFKVHPQYRELEATASRLTGEIHALNNENVAERNLAAYYRQSLEDVVEPEPSDVVRVYEEAGLVLPDLVRRRLDEVKEFHVRLVGNRRAFLSNEVSRIDRGIAERDERIRNLSNRRASTLAVLQEHGALEEFTLLQRAHLDTLAAVQDLESRVINIKKVDVGKSVLKVEQEQLYQRASADYEEREPARRRAIRHFNSHSEALYELPGRLVIEVTHTGFKFDVEIERARSTGIGNMKILCYDLTIAQLWAGRKATPGTLVHDSLIFDGVDERQISGALQRAAAVAKQDGFQYICTINSDAVPYDEFPASFDFDSHVRLRLTDESPEGCLLGVRF